MVAATINGNLQLLDAASKYSQLNLIHPLGLTYMGLLIKGKGGELINFSATPSKQLSKATLNVDKEGVLSGNLEQQYNGFYAIWEHESYDEDSEAYLKSMNKNWNLDLFNTSINHIDDGVFTIKNSFLSDNDLDVSSKKIILNPLFFLREVYKFNQTTARRSPIEFISGFEDAIEIELNLPDGYSLENPFKPAKLKTDDGSIMFNYTITQEANKLLVKSSVAVQDDTYDIEFYPIFKQVFDYINKVDNESIALVKK